MPVVGFGELEVQNTFLNFPGRLFAPTSRRRSSSWHSESPKSYSCEKDVLPMDLLSDGNDSSKPDVSPTSTDCGISCSTTLDSLDCTMDTPIGQWADYDCSQSLSWSTTDSHFSANVMEHGDSHYTPNFMENTDSHYAVEKGAYITGDGDHYDWHRVNNKGTREVKWSKKSCLVLRGLPFSASECDVADFLERCGVLGSLAPGRPIILLVNPQGRPSGFAEVNMVGEVEAEEARPAIHMQRLGGRYIEVLPNAPSKSDYKWANAGDCDTSSSIATVAQPRRGRGGQSSKSTYESIKSSSSRRVGRAAGYGFGKNAMYDQSSWNGSWRR